MKRVQGFLAAAALFTMASVSVAHADLITGSLSLTGGVAVDIGGSTITFKYGNATHLADETGSFQTLGDGLPVTWENLNTPIDFTALTTNSNLNCGTGCLFEITSGSVVLASFNLISENAPIINPNFLDLSGTGVMHLAGFDDTLGSFFLSTQGGSGPSLTFSSTVAVPGPALGVGLPGLLAACGGLLALARRRRRQTA